MTGHQQPFDFNRKLTERLDIDFVLRAAGLGVWEFNAVTSQIQWDDRCGELFGITRSRQFQYKEALSFVHPDDVERVDQAVQWALNPESEGSYQVTYRMVGEDGRTRWIQSTGRAGFDQTGQAVYLSGVVQDMTDSVHSRQQVEQHEKQFRDLVEQAPMAMAIFRGPEYVIELANDAHPGALGTHCQAGTGQAAL